MKAQSDTQTQNPFLDYSKLSQPQPAPKDSAFVIAQPKGLKESPDRVLEQIFLADDLYRTKTFTNGTQYESFCFHGPLGTYPFDGVLQRIVEKKDDFQKALVLTTSYDNAKLQAKRLVHKALTTCQKKHPEAPALLDRIRTATSIQKDDDNYKARGVDANDEQILFYDISQTRNNLGTQIERLRKAKFEESKEALEKAVSALERGDDANAELKKYIKRLGSSFAANSSLPHAATGSVIEEALSVNAAKAAVSQPLEDFNKSKKQIIQNEVQSFIERQNLKKTEQLYLDSAEEFKTDLGYEFIQELVRQLKITNGGGQLKLGAVANFNYSHGQNSSLADIFGRPHFFKPPSEYQREARVPTTKITKVRSLRDRETTSSADLAAVTKSSSFNNNLRDRIQERLVDGDKRIFVRAHSNNALDALRSSFDRKNEEQASLSYGWIRENQAGYVDSKGIEHEVSSPQQLLANWGNNFNTLIHAGYFDKLQEPADTVVTATKVKTPDRLEELATPLGTLRDDLKDTNHLIYYHFGKIKMGDAGKDQNPELLLEQINRRHNSRGNIRREIKARTSIAGAGSNGAQTSDVTEEEAALEFDWNQFPEPIRHFWTNAFGSRQKLMQYIASYVREKDTEQNIIGDTALFSNEKQYIWRLINLNSTITSRPSLIHDKREVFESLFRQAQQVRGKGIQDYIPVYPSVLGVESVAEAQNRVRHVYKPVYNEVNKSKDQVLKDMDSLATKSFDYDSRMKHRSDLIGEFLFENGHVGLLTNQGADATMTRFDDSVLTSTILSLVGRTKPNNPAQAKLAHEFKDFINLKKTQKDNLEADTKLGLSLIEVQELVGEYIIDKESELYAEDKAAEFEERNLSLTNSLAEAQPIEGGDTNKFYRYVCEHTDKLEVPDVLRVNSDLLEIENFDEAAIVISNLAPAIQANHSDVICNWQERFTNLEDRDSLLAWYVLEKDPSLLKTENHEQLRELVGLLNGGKRLVSVEEQAEFRSYVDFLYEKSPKKMSKLFSRKDSLSLENVREAVMRSNPGLMGIQSTKDLTTLVERLLRSDMNELTAKVHPKTKFANLPDHDYQTMVASFASEANFSSIASRLGVNLTRLNELSSPEEIKAKFEKGYLKLVAKAKAEAVDTSELESHWQKIWKDPDLISALAKSELIEKTFRKDFDSELEYGLNTRICDDDTKGFFVFAQGGLSYGEYIKEEYNSRNLEIDPTEKLALKWTAFSDLEVGEADFEGRKNIWKVFLHEGLDDCVAKEMVIPKALEAFPGLSVVELDPKLGLAGALGAPRRRSTSETSVRAQFYAVAESFLKALDISEDKLLDLFHEFITSEYFEQQKLAAKYPLPGAVTKFLGALSGYESKDAYGLVAEFINYLATDLDDERAVTRILKEIVTRQSNYFGELKAKFGILQDFAEGGGAKAVEVLSHVTKMTGVKRPLYPRLKLDCMMKTMSVDMESFKELPDDMKGLTVFSADNAGYAAAIDKYWDIIASEYFCVNFFDLDYNPELRFPTDDGDGVFVVEVQSPKALRPTIVTRIEKSED